MATRRRSRRKTISGNLTDIQKRVRYLETRPAPSKLASKVVATKNIAIESITEELVVAQAITRRTIADSAVGTDQIQPDSITNSLIATDAVNTDSIAPNAVTTTEIAPDAITNTQIATDAVNSDSIAPGAVGNTELSGGIADSKILGMSSSKLQGDVEDAQINTLSSSKITDVLDETNIPNLATSKITSGVLDIDTIPEITADRMPNLDASKITSSEFDVGLIPNLSATKFISGEFDETNIPNLDAAKFTSGAFATARIPNISALKITSGTLSLDQIPVFPESEIATGAVTDSKFATGAVTDAKISGLRTVRGAIVNNGLTVAYPVTKQVLTSGPASGLTYLDIVVNSSGFNVAAGDHVHGQNGYSAAGSTGVGSHTHPYSLGNPAFPYLLESGTHGGHTGGLNFGSHAHAIPVLNGSTQSNTSTLKLKKEISIYEVPDIKNLLNLQLKRYKYKNQVRYLQESLHREWMYGYIAEEVEDLGFKELVGYDEKGEPASLNYGLLSTLVLELVKVQQTEISLIREKIKRRRQKYDKLSS